MRFPLIHCGFKIFGWIFIQKIGERDSQFDLHIFFNWVNHRGENEPPRLTLTLLFDWWLSWKESGSLVAWMRVEWVKPGKRGKGQTLYIPQKMPWNKWNYSSSTSYLIFWIDVDGSHVSLIPIHGNQSLFYQRGSDFRWEAIGMQRCQAKKWYEWLQKATEKEDPVWKLRKIKILKFLG